MLVQMISQRKSGVILGYVNILVKNLVNLIYTPMLLSFVGQADYGVYQTSNSLIFSLSLLSFGFSEAYVRFYVQRKTHGTDEDILRLNGMYLLLYIVVSILALLLGLLFSWNAGVVFAGSFTQGSTIELSADAPVVKPYTLYMQGGLTFEYGKLSILLALTNIKKQAE